MSVAGSFFHEVQPEKQYGAPVCVESTPALQFHVEVWSKIFASPELHTRLCHKIQALLRHQGRLAGSPGGLLKRAHHDVTFSCRSLISVSGFGFLDCLKGCSFLSIISSAVF